MALRLLASALFKVRNLAILLISISSAYIAASALPEFAIFALALGPGIYIVSVIQSLTSDKFHESYIRKQKIKELRSMNFKCWKLSREAKRHTNQRYNQQMRKVMDDKNTIINTFFRGEESYIMEKVAMQSLKLVTSYLRLLINFCIRSRELDNVDTNTLTSRINMNLRRLNFIKDIDASEDIKKVIEIDEKLIVRLKEESNELERISAKLDYMAGTVNMFRHQVLSSIESEEMLEKLETAVNEASALDNVLEDRKRARVKN